MPFSLFIALRFLFRSRSDAPLTLFTAVAVIGIAASVFLFLVIDSVMNGFEVRLREVLVGFDAPLTQEVASSDVAETRQNLALFVKKHPEYGLQSAEGREFYGLLEQRTEMPLGIKARAVGEDFFRLKKGRLQIFWNEGFDEASFLASTDALILGEDVYKSLPDPFGSEVARLIHPFAELGPGGDLEPHSKSFVIAGFFTTGYYDIDHLYVFLPANSLEDFADPELSRTEFYLKPADIRDTETVKSAWQKEYPNDSEVWLTWLEKNTALFRAMSLEKLIFYALFVLLVMIACLNLAGVIHVFGIGKLRDGVILRALGLSTQGVAGIFGMLGALLGTLGGFLGVGAGACVILFFEHRGISLPEAYGFGELPLHFEVSTALVLLLVAPVLGALVAWTPARQIARNAVTQSLRET